MRRARASVVVLGVRQLNDVPGGKGALGGFRAGKGLRLCLRLRVTLAMLTSYKIAHSSRVDVATFELLQDSSGTLSLPLGFGELCGTRSFSGYVPVLLFQVVREEAEGLRSSPSISGGTRCFSSASDKRVNEK